MPPWTAACSPAGSVESDASTSNSAAGGAPLVFSETGIDGKVDITIVYQMGSSGDKNDSLSLVGADGTEILSMSMDKDSNVTATIGAGDGTTNAVAAEKITSDNASFSSDKKTTINGNGGRQASNWFKLEATVDFSNTSTDNVTYKLTNIDSSKIVIDNATGKTTAANLAKMDITLGKTMGAISFDDITVVPNAGE